MGQRPDALCVQQTFDKGEKIWDFLAPMPANTWPLLTAAAVLLGGPLANAAPLERRAVVFYTADTHGVLEPCGCTSEPLGDFARVTALVRAEVGSRRGALLVDGGNLSFPAGPIPPKRRAAARLRAEFLARELGRLPFAGSAVGESDLAWGADQVLPKRLAANLEAPAFVEPSRLVETGGIRFGVLGIVAPDVARRAGLSASDPGAAARAEVARLRKKGAEVVVLLAPVERTQARHLARTAGADIVVVGKNVGTGMRRAERVGNAFLVAPGEELQYVGRLDIVLRGPAPRGADEPLADAGGADQARERLVEIERRLERLAADLARWQQDPASDPAFLAGKRRERDALAAEQARLAKGLWRPPATGSYLTNTLIPIRRTLPRDSALARSLRTLDQAVGAANLAAAEPPPPPEPGRAFYVGHRKCVSCHKSADRQWRRTGHARAWQTLVELGKQNHDDCVVCHVTGFGEVGGASLGHTKGLENVQCEACHQPKSIHVEKRGKEAPYAGSTGAPESVCVRCHNETHSDTFQYEPYLRGILGPGHGELLLDKLGPGPTARELRRAAAARGGKP
ncbi:MAG: hypothetical protein JXP73_02775 [Deltaproteobacteria bacterium]|nr:hypothetical protein [Deltaproteobacteria bacterium]